MLERERVREQVLNVFTPRVHAYDPDQEAPTIVGTQVFADKKKTNSNTCKTKRLTSYLVINVSGKTVPTYFLVSSTWNVA